MTRDWQEDVRDFHVATGGTIGETPALRDMDLRTSLIAEEAAETWVAIQHGDLAGAIDGMVDLIYVTIGTAVAMGVDLQPFWDEVHRANMSKARGPKRADGKQLKPEGWKPPEIDHLLAEQIAWTR